MVKKLDRFVFFILFLVSGFFVFALTSTQFNKTVVYAEEDSAEVFLGGVVSDSSATLGSIDNPCSTFLEAKEVLGLSNGTIYINGKLEITDEQSWSLLSGQTIKRYSTFLDVMISLSGSATLNLTDVVVDGNSSVLSSGSVFKLSDTSTLNLNSGSKICGNNTSSRGAGILLMSSTASVNVYGAEISGNTTTQQGGACFLSYGSSFVLNSGTICQNQAKVGGAFFVSAGAKLSLLGGNVEENVATGTGAVAGAIYSLDNLYFGNSPQVNNNVCTDQTTVQSNIYLCFGKAVYLTTELDESTFYTITVFATSVDLPPRAVIVGFRGDLSSSSQYFNNFSFTNDTYGYSIGANEFEGNIMVDRYVSLTFVAENGTEEQTVFEGIESGVDYVMPNSLFAVPNGFVFAGWTISLGSMAEFGALDTYSVWDSQTFYAVYTKNVTYNANGGQGTLVGTRIYNVPYVCEMGTQLVRDGFCLKGWGVASTTKQVDTNFFELGSVISDAVLNYYNYTLFAVWEENEYIVSFDAKGGSPVDSVGVMYGFSIEEPTTTKLGFEFLGWFLEENDVVSDVEFDFENTKMPSKNIKLVAKWQSLFKNSESYEIGDNFEIETVLQLQNLSNVVNQGKVGYINGQTVQYSTLNYKLVCNLDFIDSTTANFVPIGTSHNAFGGVFDGGLNKIFRINVSNNYSNAGLFGVLNRATVKNVIVVQGYVNSLNNVGGIAGQATNSNIVNCAFGGNIVGTNVGACVGGIVGFALFSSQIESCIASINLISNSVAGGIAGKISETTLKGCASILSAVSGQDKAGGIVGFVDTGSVLTDCYVDGQVNEATFLGAIAGYNLAEIDDCYYILSGNNSGSINNENIYDKAMGLFGCQMLSLNDDVCGFGLSNQFANATASSGNKLFDFKAKSGDYAYLPIVSGFNGILDDMFKVKAYTATFQLQKNDETQIFYQYVPQNERCFEPFYITYSSIDWFNGQTQWNFILDKVNSDLTLNGIYENGKNYFSGGDGTAENPFEIDNYTNLATLTNLINSFVTYNFFADKCYVLTSDIDCSNKQMKIIGNFGHKFLGVFDGNNHFIKNFNLSTTANYVGLFGYNSGIIKNLNFYNFAVSGADFVGIVAGYNAGQILNVKNENTNTKTVSGNNYVGGICGYNSNVVSDCTIFATIKCENNYAGGIAGYSKGNNSQIVSCISVSAITATCYAGGIVGYAYDGTVALSFYAGQLQSRYAGGIVGYANLASVLYVTNVGYIFGSEYVGGIVGFGGTEAVLQGSYSLGDVVGTSKIGSIAGQFAGSVLYCYYEKTTNSVGGINGTDVALKTIGLPAMLMLTVDGAISQYFDSNFSQATLFSQQVWYAVENSNGKWFFPIQTSLLSTLQQLFYASNYQSVTLTYTKQSGSGEQFSFNVALPYGFLTANIVPYFGSFMGIEQNNSELLQWFSESTFENLVLQTEETQTQLFAKWNVAFSGLGTLESPFIIETENDLITLSALVNNPETHAIYATKTYRLNGNIFITTENFTPIGINEQLPFMGTFLGNNKTINGLYLYNSLKTNVGLFGVAKNARIENLYITNGQIEAYANAGAFVGLLLDSEIENCYSNINVISNTSNAGGIVGKANNSQISLCVSYSNYIITKENAGGILGVASNNTVINQCVANSVVNAINVAGGIVGAMQQSQVCYCASLSYVMGTSKIAGIVGISYDLSSILNSYFVNTLSGQTDVAGIVASAINCEIENCFYNAERCTNKTAVIGMYNTVNNVDGVSSLFMTTEMFLGDEMWEFTLPSNNQFYYPVVANITNLGHWYDTLECVQFEVSNLLIDENLKQYGYVLQGATYNFKIKINEDRQYNLATLVVQIVNGDQTTTLESNNGIYSIVVSESIKIVASIEPVKRIVVVESNLDGSCLEDGTNYVDDKGTLTINFVPNKNCYVKSVLIDGNAVQGWTNTNYTLDEIDSNLKISIIFDKLWIEKTFEQQDASISITGENVYYDTTITAILVKQDSELMKQFKKNTSGTVLCAYDFVSNCSSEEMLKSELNIRVYVGTLYNTQNIDLMLLDDNQIKTVQSKVENGYVTISASKLRAFAIVKQNANYGWIWLLAFVVVCIILFIAIFALSKRNVVKSNGKQKVFADKVDLNYVKKRNDYCVSKPIKPTSTTVLNGTKKRKKTEAKTNSQAQIISKEKKKNAFDKLGKIKKNKD